MSLIYFALNRLENKSDTSNSLQGKHLSEKINANEYLLPTEKTGIPLWLLVILGLSCIGVLAGWFLTRQIKEIEEGVRENIHSQKVIEQKLSVPPIPTLLPEQKTEGDLVKGKLVKEISSDLPVDLVNGNNEQTPLALNKIASDDSIKTQLLKEPETTHQDTTQVVTPVKQEVSSLIEIKVESNNENIKRNTKKSSSKVDEIYKKTEVEVNSQQIKQLIYAIKAAVKADKSAESDALLAKLQLLLEPESMTLLHLQAWRQMNGGDQEISKSIYQQIISRNPEDEIAAINLALILWKSGNHNEARKVIETISVNRPDSEAVQNYRRQFGERK